MNRALLILLFCGLAGISRAADDPEMKLLMRDRQIVILGSFRNFKEANDYARAISHRSGVPFSLQGKIYDHQRGLILPDDDPDTFYAGAYYPRRDDTTHLPGHAEEVEYLSIERSEAYPGLRPGYYIIVGGLHNTRQETVATLARFHLPAADAYVKKTQVFMGCRY